MLSFPERRGKLFVDSSFLGTVYDDDFASVGDRDVRKCLAVLWNLLGTHSHAFTQDRVIPVFIVSVALFEAQMAFADVTIPGWTHHLPVAVLNRTHKFNHLKTMRTLVNVSRH